MKEIINIEDYGRLVDGKQYKLPKLYRVIKAIVPVLRVGYSYDGAYEYDTFEVRRVRRIRTRCGWKWQIALKELNQRDWDYHLDCDQEILDDASYCAQICA